MKYHLLFSLLLLLGNTILAQEVNITSEHFKPYTHYFSLTKEHQLEQKIQPFFLDAIGNHQFVGIAEVHDSKQLSYFTKGFLELLKKKEFNYFALEVGPYSANIIQGMTERSQPLPKSIKKLNRTYGKRFFPKAPIPFINNLEDADFLEKAAVLDFKFWGIDQEFIFSYEMFLDTLFVWVDQGDEELRRLYQKSKKTVRKNIFKRVVNGQPQPCWMLTESTLNQFFERCKGHVAAEQLIATLKRSLDIYCKSASNQPSIQLRADYMKTNFDSLYAIAQHQNTTLPKVFVKLGGVHLTHGVSVFGAHDVGEHLSKKAQQNQTGFLAIRHLSKYRKGKNVTGKSGWKGLEILMSLGKKEEWTVIDLRSIRKQIANKELRASEKIKFETRSYDLLVIPPNDKKARRNY